MTRRVLNRDILQPESHWWHRWRLSTQKFAVLLSIGACVAGFSYVFITNQTAADGFAIKSLEKQIAELKSGNQKLELQAADLRSLSAVEQTSMAMGLVPTDKFEYLPATAGAVAVK